MQLKLRNTCPELSDIELKYTFFFFLEKDDETKNYRKNYRKDKILLVSLAMFVFLGISGRTG